MKAKPTLRSALDAACNEDGLRGVAAELNIDAPALIARWRSHIESQVSGGVSQADAAREAYRHVVAESRRRRAEADRAMRGRGRR